MIQQKSAGRSGIRQKPDATLMAGYRNTAGEKGSISKKKTADDQRIISKGSRLINSTHVLPGSDNFDNNRSKSGSLAIT